MIRFKGAQRFFQILRGTLTGALRRLSRQKDPLAERRQHIPINLLGFSVPVDAGRIEVVDAEFVGAQGDRLGIFIAAHREATPGLAYDSQLFTGLAENAARNVPWFQLAGLSA